MRNKFTTMLATLAIAMTALVGFTGVSVATADTAEAATYSNCYKQRSYGGSYASQLAPVKVCYVKYNWWERSWFGGFNRNGWEVVGPW